MSAPAVARPAWPQCQAAMRALAWRLIQAGAEDADIMRELHEAFPGLLYDSGPEWRRDAIYQNVMAMEQMAAAKQAQARRPLAAERQGSMSPGLVAFAEARGLVCAYCGRAGTRSGDPNGLAWHRDSVPRGFQAAGRDLELSCSECKKDPDRWEKLGGDLDGY